MKLTDMHIRESPRELLAGPPACAPAVAVMTEAVVGLIRSLQNTPAWAATISQYMCSALDTLHAWSEEGWSEPSKHKQPNPKHVCEDVELGAGSSVDGLEGSSDSVLNCDERKNEIKDIKRGKFLEYILILF